MNPLLVYNNDMFNVLRNTDLSYLSQQDEHNCDLYNDRKHIQHLEDTQYSNKFFSNENINYINRALPYFFYKKFNILIKHQDPNKLKDIMKRVFERQDEIIPGRCYNTNERITIMNRRVISICMNLLYSSYTSLNTELVAPHDERSLIATSVKGTKVVQWVPDGFF